MNGLQRVYCHMHPDAQLIDDYETGDIICPSCGLVLVDRMANMIVDAVDDVSIETWLDRRENHYYLTDLGTCVRQRNKRRKQCEYQISNFSSVLLLRRFVVIRKLNFQIKHIVTMTCIG